MQQGVSSCRQLSQTLKNPQRRTAVPVQFVREAIFAGATFEVTHTAGACEREGVPVCAVR